MRTITEQEAIDRIKFYEEVLKFCDRAEAIADDESAPLEELEALVGNLDEIEALIEGMGKGPYEVVIDE